MIVCNKVKKGIFKDTVELYCSEDCSVVFDSFMGERVFFMREGTFKTVKIAKKAMAQGGEIREFTYWLKYCDPFDFNWDWHY